MSFGWSARARTVPRAVAVKAAVAVALAGVLVTRVAWAGKNDLQLLNLCAQQASAPGTLPDRVPECSWVTRQPGTGLVQSVAFDPEAETRFRSLMSELGAVIAPRLVIPADTLGWSGFQVSAELGMTSINNQARYWDGVAGVSPANTTARPDARLTTVGMFVRKGLWLPLPAMEVGAGVLNVLDSQMVAFQGYAKLGLHEGFHEWPIPSLAVRGGVSHLTGTGDVRLDVYSVDVLVSKAIGFLGTARLEPFGGWSWLAMRARSGLIDATPSCDATLVASAAPGAALGGYCAEAQRGTGNDYEANFLFPKQDMITRYRFFAGMKVKFAWFFMAAQYEIVPEGKSRDERKADGARDTSAQQDTLSLSGGFDY